MSKATDGGLRENRVATAFVELADTLVDDFDVIDFLDRLAARCVELLEVSAAGLMLADQRGVLRTAAASDENTSLLELFELQHDQGPCLDCFRSGRALPYVDLRSDSDADKLWPTFTPRARIAGFASSAALPLRLRHQVIGVLNLFHVRPGPLDESRLQLAQALADAATIGILQQRTIRENELLAGQLKSALDSRVAIEQAKGVLAERWGVAPAEAFTTMRAYARGNNLRLADLAHSVVYGQVDTEHMRAGGRAAGSAT